MDVSGVPDRLRSLRAVTQQLVLLENGVLDRIAADAAIGKGRTERGGILLGYRRWSHLHVLEATLPMPHDRMSRFMFRRSKRGHQRVASSRWRQSGGRIDWLGEWHSHPERQPRPSSIDLASWRDMVHRRGSPMLFIIIGEEGLWIGTVAPNAAYAAEYVERERSAFGVGYVPREPHL